MENLALDWHFNHFQLDSIKIVMYWKRWHFALVFYSFSISIKTHKEQKSKRKQFRSLYIFPQGVSLKMLIDIKYKFQWKYFTIVINWKNAWHSFISPLSLHQIADIKRYLLIYRMYSYIPPRSYPVNKHTNSWRWIILIFSPKNWLFLGWKKMLRWRIPYP